MSFAKTGKASPKSSVATVCFSVQYCGKWLVFKEQVSVIVLYCLAEEGKTMTTFF